MDVDVPERYEVSHPGNEDAGLWCRFKVLNQIATFCSTFLKLNLGFFSLEGLCQSLSSASDSVV